MDITNVITSQIPNNCDEDDDCNMEVQENNEKNMGPGNVYDNIILEMGYLRNNFT